VATYEEMRSAAEAAWSAVEKPSRTLFVVSINTSSMARGARETFDALRALGETQGFDVMQTGDTGMAFAEPVVKVVRPNGPTVLYGNVTADTAEAFASAALSGVAISSLYSGAISLRRPIDSRYCSSAGNAGR